jgi:hypothetical protein
MWRLLLLLACLTTAISALKPLPPCPQSSPGASSLALPDCMMTGEPLSRDGALSLVVGSRSRENDPATAFISWMPDGAVARPGSQGTEAWAGHRHHMLKLCLLWHRSYCILKTICYHFSYRHTTWLSGAGASDARGLCACNAWWRASCAVATRHAGRCRPRQHAQSDRRTPGNRRARYFPGLAQHLCCRTWQWRWLAQRVLDGARTRKANTSPQHTHLYTSAPPH